MKSKEISDKICKGEEKEEPSPPKITLGWARACCCCLLCNHCNNWTWVVEVFLAFGTRLRSTHCREFYLYQTMHGSLITWLNDSLICAAI